MEFSSTMLSDSDEDSTSDEDSQTQSKMKQQLLSMLDPGVQKFESKGQQLSRLTKELRYKTVTSDWEPTLQQKSKWVEPRLHTPASNDC